MLMKEGLLVTANARIAPIATTVSPVPVLIGRFYPLQRYLCLSAGRLVSRGCDEFTPGARGASTTDSRSLDHPSLVQPEHIYLPPRITRDAGMPMQPGHARPWVSTR